MAAAWRTGSFLRQHFFTALVPAFLLAGAISALVERQWIVRYLGAGASAFAAYGIAAGASGVSALCSCMVLPVFAGIYLRGAGLGPAITFLYCGPAINVMALILTASVLGLPLGAARAVSAVLLGIVVGLLMQRAFGEESTEDEESGFQTAGQSGGPAAWKAAVVLALIMAATAGANWARTGQVEATVVCCPGGSHSYEVQGRLMGREGGNLVLEGDDGRVQKVPSGRVVSVRRHWLAGSTSAALGRWAIVGGFLAGAGLVIARWFRLKDIRDWLSSSADFAVQMVPLFLAGVLVTGLLFGHRSVGGIVPDAWIRTSVGGGTVLSNATASVAGAAMYFATLTEVPIVQALLDSGMGRGPALAMLLAGPAVSLPNLLVIRSVIGTKKTVAYGVLVAGTATVAGLVYGALAAL